MNRFAIAYWTETKGLGLAIATTSLADPKAAADEYFASIGLGGMVLHSKVIAIGPISEEIGQKALAQQINKESLSRAEDFSNQLQGSGHTIYYNEKTAESPDRETTKPPTSDPFAAMSSSRKGPALGA